MSRGGVHTEVADLLDRTVRIRHEGLELADMEMQVPWFQCA